MSQYEETLALLPAYVRLGQKQDDRICFSMWDSATFVFSYSLRDPTMGENTEGLAMHQNLTQTDSDGH